MAAMADAFRTALNQIHALAHDHRSGAAEIAARAATILIEFARRSGQPDPRLAYRLPELAEALHTAQPSMASLINLANLIQRAAEQNRISPRKLQTTLEHFRRGLDRATNQIARLFARRLRRQTTVLSYSYSSTVLAALLTARKKMARVFCSESRPLLEGRTLAQKLAAAGVPVTFLADAALPARLAESDLVVVGADAVLETAYVNKVGTRLLQEQARGAGKPFYLLADTSKFLPPALARFFRIEAKPAAELWPHAPAQIEIENRYFEQAPFAAHVVLLCEWGAFSSARLRAWLARQPVARRWRL